MKGVRGGERDGEGEQEDEGTDFDFPLVEVGDCAVAVAKSHEEDTLPSYQGPVVNARSSQAKSIREVITIQPPRIRVQEIPRGVSWCLSLQRKDDVVSQHLRCLCRYDLRDEDTLHHPFRFSRSLEKIRWCAHIVGNEPPKRNIILDLLITYPDSLSWKS